MTDQGGQEGDAGPSSTQQDQQQTEGLLSFSDFLETMKDPKAADLVRMIKQYVLYQILLINLFLICASMYIVHVLQVSQRI
jgi:hypothetical protein